MRNLRHKVAIITGAGSGIGRATSLELAARGCEVALVDLNKDEAAKTARIIGERGGKASVHQADVSDRGRMSRLPDEVLARHGRANILVNNAGVGVIASFEDHSLEDLDWILGINLWGTIYGCKFFLPALKESGEGHIVNISSIAGFFPVPGMSSYTVSKFAVRGLSESLRAELQDANIGVTSVHPGAINTNIPKTSRYLGPGASKLRHQGVMAVAAVGKAPEFAAKKIVNGIQKNAARVLIGPDAHVLDVLARTLPSASSQIISFVQKFGSRLMKKGTMQEPTAGD